MTQTNQGALIEALQTELGAGFEDRTLEGLWHELWDDNSIAGTTFNERMLNYLNAYLGTSYTYLPQAMQAYAEELGFYNWSSIGTWDLSLGAGPSGDGYLLESGDYMLLESGDFMLLE